MKITRVTARSGVADLTRARVLCFRADAHALDYRNLEIASGRKNLSTAVFRRAGDRRAGGVAHDYSNLPYTHVYRSLTHLLQLPLTLLARVAELTQTEWERLEEESDYGKRPPLHLAADTNAFPSAVRSVALCWSW